MTPRGRRSVEQEDALRLLRRSARTEAGNSFMIGRRYDLSVTSPAVWMQRALYSW